MNIKQAPPYIYSAAYGTRIGLAQEENQGLNFTNEQGFNAMQQNLDCLTSWQSEIQSQSNVPESQLHSHGGLEQGVGV